VIWKNFGGCIAGAKKLVRRTVGARMIGTVSGRFYRLPRNVIAIFSGRNLLGAGDSRF